MPKFFNRLLPDLKNFLKENNRIGTTTDEQNPKTSQLFDLRTGYITFGIIRFIFVKLNLYPGQSF